MGASCSPGPPTPVPTESVIPGRDGSCVFDSARCPCRNRVCQLSRYHWPRSWRANHALPTVPLSRFRSSPKSCAEVTGPNILVSRRGRPSAACGLISMRSLAPKFRALWRRRQTQGPPQIQPSARLRRSEHGDHRFCRPARSGHCRRCGGRWRTRSADCGELPPDSRLHVRRRRRASLVGRPALPCPIARGAEAASCGSVVGPRRIAADGSHGLKSKSPARMPRGHSRNRGCVAHSMRSRVATSNAPEPLLVCWPPCRDQASTCKYLCSERAQPKVADVQNSNYC